MRNQSRSLLYNTPIHSLHIVSHIKKIRNLIGAKTTNLIIGLCSLVGRNLAVPFLALGPVPLRCLAGVSAITIASTSTSASTSTPTAATASAGTSCCIVVIVGRNLVCSRVPGLAGFNCPWLPPMARINTSGTGRAILRGLCIGPAKGNLHGIRTRFQNV